MQARAFSAYITGADLRCLHKRKKIKFFTTVAKKIHNWRDDRGEIFHNWRESRGQIIHNWREKNSQSGKSFKCVYPRTTDKLKAESLHNFLIRCCCCKAGHQYSYDSRESGTRLTGWQTRLFWLLYLPIDITARLARFVFAAQYRPGKAEVN